MLPQKLTQLQCYQTNKELTNSFISETSTAFKYLPNILKYLYNQIQALIGFIDYRFTIAIDQPQPGDKLQNLTFPYQKLSQKIKLFWLLLNIVIPYLWKRITSLLGKVLSEQFNDRVYHTMGYIEKIYRLLEFINLALFIKDGKYRNLVERILQIKLKFIKNDSNRILYYTLMNRKLIWQIYQLFIQTIIPFSQKIFSKTLKNIFYFTSYLEVQSQQNNCIFCQQKYPVMPLIAEPCSHHSCYYCFSTALNTSICLRCNQNIISWKKQYIQ